jgi:photosystem II stability/assembly factor-like uncharacterized protein
MKRLYILLFVLFAMNSLNAQWTYQNSGTTMNLNSIYFTDANTGYTVGNSGTILKSINAGDQWLSQTSNTWNTLNSTCFTDAETGYTVGDSGTILKTTNGGINWEPQISGTTSNLLSVVFPVTDTGYAAGEYGTFLKTIDGGTTWTSMNFDSATTIKAVFFISDDTGYIIGERWIGGWISNVAFVRKTVNGGTDWIGGYSFSSTTASVTFSSIYFVNSEIGYVSGAVSGYFGYSLQIKTINGGTDWIDCIPGETRSMYFTDSETGYSVGGGIKKTTDAGLSWQTQFLDASILLKSTYFPTTDTGYTVGSGGIILKTTNGGGNPTGINKNHQTECLNIYPNPANRLVTITCNNGSIISELTIYNQTGQIVLKGKPVNNTLDISKLSPGMYVVEIGVGQWKARKKLMVE